MESNSLLGITIYEVSYFTPDPNPNNSSIDQWGQDITNLSQNVLPNNSENSLISYYLHKSITTTGNSSQNTLNDSNSNFCNNNNSLSANGLSNLEMRIQRASYFNCAMNLDLFIRNTSETEIFQGSIYINVLTAGENGVFSLTLPELVIQPNSDHIQNITVDKKDWLYQEEEFDVTFILTNLREEIILKTTVKK